MYLPPHFRIEDRATLHEAMRAYPLATIVTADNDGLPMASHVPMWLDPAPTPNGTLLCHLARANDQWKSADGRTALVMFRGPDAYITPSWYATKRETAKVVPTWNYIAVHVYGTVHAFDDASRLHQLVSNLTEAREAGREAPWNVDDAPESYVANQLRGIVGLEIRIERIFGKWKLNQNKSEADRRGNIAGLRTSADQDAHAIASAMEHASERS